MAYYSAYIIFNELQTAYLAFSECLPRTRLYGFLPSTGTSDLYAVLFSLVTELFWQQPSYTSFSYDLL